MIDDPALQHVAERLLYREGYYLDAHNWDAWLGLYAEDATYWVPSWKSEYEPTSSPDSELSMIYYTNRHPLEDRVARVAGGLSPASVPLWRTVHSTSNVLLVEASADRLDVRSTWATDMYQPQRKQAKSIFGRAETVLSRRDGQWLITSKKIIVVSELLLSSIDFYQL